MMEPGYLGRLHSRPMACLSSVHGTIVWSHHQGTYYLIRTTLLAPFGGHLHGQRTGSVHDVIIDGCMGVVATFTLLAAQTMVSQLN